MIILSRLAAVLLVSSCVGAACGLEISPTIDASATEALVPPPAPPGPSTIEASVAHFSFAPEAIRVEAGSTVVWTNDDGRDHTITPTHDAGEFGGDLEESGGALIARFDEPGTFGYFCSIHSHMAGVVIVT